MPLFIIKSNIMAAKKTAKRQTQAEKLQAELNKVLKEQIKYLQAQNKSLQAQNKELTTIVLNLSKKSSIEPIKERRTSFGTQKKETKVKAEQKTEKETLKAEVLNKLNELKNF